MFKLFRGAKDSTTVKRFAHQSAFSVSAPSSWKQDTSGDHFSITAPDDSAACTGSAYGRQPEGTLDDFAEYRWSSVHEFYSQIGEERREAVNDLNIIAREFEGIWPGDSNPTYYVVHCIEMPTMYVSLAITTTREHFIAQRALYESIVKSVQAA